MTIRLLGCLALLLSLTAVAAPPRGYVDHTEALGRQYAAPGIAPAATPAARRETSNAVDRWNRVAIDASGLDHTPVAPGETRVFGEQLGPARASRAIAIVQIAVFEAANATAPRYRSYA